MSSLLKKKDGVVAFGFPLMGNGSENGGPESVRKGAEKPPDPEASPEEVYRKKLLELERRTQEIERDAYARGFAQGEKDGLEYGQKTVQVIKAQLERTIENLDGVPGNIFKDYRDWLITTSLQLARRIVRRELAIAPEIVAGVVNSLLDEAEEHSTLTVYLNPLDIEFLEKRADLVLGGKRKHLTLKGDGSLERGGCRVESDVQILDASLDVQFEELEKYILKDSGRGDSTGAGDGK